MAARVSHDDAPKPDKSKALPVLPWMRVPISIEAGTGVPLTEVRGLHPLALAALRRGKLCATPDECMHAKMACVTSGFGIHSPATLVHTHTITGA